MIYEVELEGPDGKTYVAELEGPEIKDLNKPKAEKPAIDILGSAKKGLDAITKPTPSQMALGGLDPFQRFAQTTATDIYGQSRGQLQGMVPQSVNRLLGTGIAGAVPGGVMLPSQTREEIGRQGVGLGIDVMAGTAANKLAGTMVNGLSQARLPSMELPGAIKNATTGETQFLNKIRGEFVKSKQAAVDKFGDQLDALAIKNPDAKVNISSVLDELKQEVAQEPKLKSAINRVPGLKSMLDSESTTGELSLKESQKIINDLTSKVPTVKLRGANVRPDDIPLIDAIHNIRAAQLEAFPEMSAVRSEYGRVLGDYGLIRNRIKPGSLQSNLRRGFGDVELDAAVKRLLPKEVLGQIKSYARTVNAGRLLRDSGINAVRYAAPVGGLGVVLKAIFGHKG